MALDDNRRDYELTEAKRRKELIAVFVTSDGAREAFVSQSQVPGDIITVTRFTSQMRTIFPFMELDRNVLRRDPMNCKPSARSQSAKGTAVAKTA